MTSSLISKRGLENVRQLDIPWRFAPNGANQYSKETNPTGLISFAAAENSYVVNLLEDFLKDNNFQIFSSSFTYGSKTKGGPLFPELMASHINTHFHPIMPINSDNLFTACSVTAAQNMLSFGIGDTGEAILVSPPIYGRFEMDYGNAARMKVLYARMKDTDPFELAVVDRLEEALINATWAGTRVRALLISNPINPLGYCYPRETLIALMAFCQRHSIHLISDEIYALSVFSPPESTSAPFTSVLSIDTSNLIDQNLLHVLYGMSKDFGSGGLSIGCIITRNTTLLRCCETIARFHTPSGPALQIACEILGQPEFVRKFLDISHQRLREGYKLTTNTLDNAGIPYYRGSNSGHFVYVNLSGYLRNFESDKGDGKDSEFSLAQHILDHGVFLHPKEEHNEKPGYFRMAFASVSLEMLAIGLERLISALKKIEPEKY